ncbi:MAG: hypothetical protein EP330_21175, partial [Deltaproteobacteria bacterium]
MPRLTRGLAPGWVLLLLAVVQADALVDWSLLRAEIAARPGWLRALAGAALVGLWAQSTAPAVRGAIRAPEDRWRWRLPLSTHQLALALAPVWLLAVAPLVWFGHLMALPLALPAAAVHPLLALASDRRGEAVLGVALAALALALGDLVPLGLLIGALGAWRGAGLVA